MRNEEIPLLARILQVVDIYDALTTARPYKTAMSHEQALQVLEEESARGWRDPDLVSIFREVTSAAPSRILSPPECMPSCEPVDVNAVKIMQSSLDKMQKRLAESAGLPLNGDLHTGI
jgi:HD-GYP domain-containing protein (c-di-GMP phosphodiesterase class II)